MKFIQVLRQQKKRGGLVRTPLYFKSGTLSIQASIAHRSIPKANLEDIDDYTHFEIGLTCDREDVKKILKRYKIDKINGLCIYAPVSKKVVEKVYLKMEEADKELTK